MPKISVLITSYNSEKFIDKALKSLINQTFKDFEIILIEDGSTDSTLEIINTFKDPRLKIYKKSNTGLIDSLNFGIKKCNSELIARFDSDDLCFKNRLEMQYSNFNLNDSVLSSNAILINEKDEIIGKTKFSSKESTIKKSLQNLNNCIIHPTVLINKNYLINSGSYNQHYKDAEDYELWLKISKFGKIKLIEEPLIYLRKHSSNISHLNLDSQLFSSIKALLKSKLNDSSITEEQISLFVEMLLKKDNSYKHYLNSTNFLINNTSKNYYITLLRVLYKLLYKKNKKKIISNINKLVNDIG